MYNGNKLIELGFKPAKWFKEAINILNTLPLGTSDEIMKEAVQHLVPPAPIEPFSTPVDYFANIRATNPDEVANIASVRATMDVLMLTPTVVGGAIMPDACPTGENGQIPVGGIVATKNAIHPSMHSADVCCSVMTTNMGKVDPKDVLDAAFGITQFGPGGRKEHGGWENLLYDNSLHDKILSNYFTKDYIVKAAKHLGTQGDGNHFLFVGVSEATGDTHLVTHHGSRGFGASVYKKGMDTAEKFRRALSPGTLPRNAWIPYDEIEGKLYWEALQIVREWTKLNHEVIHNKVLNSLKAQMKDRFWNEHNFVFKDSEDVFYHAKGATPLLDEFVPDNHTGLRLIPLNMSEPILVVRGNQTKNNMGFAPHGAGRNTSRAEHFRRNVNKTTEQIFKEETAGLDIRFFSGHVDISELPSAYKNADTVQAQMEEFGLGEVVDRINPYGCIMAGDWKKDHTWKKK